MANIEFLEEGLERIKADPDSWNQSTWRCETGMCYAGHIAFVGGYNWLYPDDTTFSEGAALVVKDGNVQHVEDAAINLLELPVHLSDAIANQLFDAHNTLPILEEMVAKIKEGELNPEALAEIAFRHMKS